MKIRAICTDIDGTLLDSNRQISARTKTAFSRLPSDFPIILASSRMPSAMTHLLQEINRTSNPLICYNGGYVLGMDTIENILQPVDSVCISLKDCTKILEMALGSSIHISLYHADEWYAPQMDRWTRKEELATKVQSVIRANTQVIEKWENEAAGAHKVMCMGDAREIDQLFTSLQKVLENTLHLYRSKDTYIEIAPKAISKASGLELVLGTYFDISMAEVMAFGDNYNDIDLLASVGMGVAVENARDEVKAVANEITAKNTEDGVAIAIEKYLL
ncbi:MAG TPA: Cof-type HAD-IIB family hydrolase [Lunatimonas sp.]|nr:Cof-type HAD-IIB family hydrolase [Lunatimonas sp.]